MRIGDVRARWVGIVGVVVLALAGVLGGLMGPQREARAQLPASVLTDADDVAQARSLSRAFQAVARKAEPTVVHITQLNRVLLRRSLFDEGQVAVRPTGLGSGVVVSSDGYILTNNHVVRQADSLRVRFADGREFDARRIGGDELTDIAVIKIEGTGFRPAEFADSDGLEVGEWVVAVGSPFGFDNTVTAGIVSAKGRSGVPLPGQDPDAYQDFIQTDAAINPGNSGGPLLNLEGKVVGINSAIASRSGGYMGIGFAIPANMARGVMDSIIRNGWVVRGWLGVDLAESVRADGRGPRGVTIQSVVPGGPAERAGLRAGDLITRYQGRAAESLTRLRADIALSPPGTSIPLEVYRGGQTRLVTVQIGDQTQGIAESMGGVAVRQIGVIARTVTPEIAQELGYRRITGAVVVRVEPGSIAASAGLRPRDVIVEADGKATATAEALAKVIGEARLSRGVRLNVVREGMRGYIEVQE